MAASAAATSAVSTPSATDRMPSARTRPTSDLTISSLSAASNSVVMNDASTLTSLTGRRLSLTSDDEAVPKSSRLIATPSAASAPTAATAVRGLAASTPSLISSMRSPGARPCVRQAAADHAR